MGNNRIARINEELKREISNTIMYLKDPRISKLCSVISVDASADLKYCKIYISVLDAEEKQNETILGLKSASGFIKKELAKKVKLRNIPQLNFILDDSIIHGANISQILKNIVPEEEKENE
jgi:ribosome-binding factor A